MTLKTLRRYRSANGLAYAKQGNGKPILLIHGVGLRAESWIYQIECLSKTNTVFTVDMPGHGESDLLENTAGIDQYVDTIAQWVKLEINDPVIVLGHSMGAMIALNFASRYPQLCLGVAALNAVYRRTSKAKACVRQRALDIAIHPEAAKPEAAIERWFSNTTSDVEQEMAELCKHWLRSAPHQGYAQAYKIFSQNDGPIDAALSGLRAPAMFITGDGDVNSSAKMSQKMSALCPCGTVAVIENARHMAQMTHSQQINALLKTFISQCTNNQLAKNDRFAANKRAT